jgi:ribose/xylose/arabinose/galactoside ABC-type transport system permease subunit
LIHGPEKVYRGRVATGNTLCWWLHSLSFYHYCKLIGGFVMIVHTIQWIFGLLLSLILLFVNANGATAWFPHHVFGRLKYVIGENPHFSPIHGR